MSFFFLIPIEGKVVPRFNRVHERFILTDQALPDIGRAIVEFRDFVDDRFPIAGHFTQVEGTAVERQKVDRLDHFYLGRKPGGMRRAISPDHSNAFDIELFWIGGSVFIEPIFGNRFCLERIEGLAEKRGIGLAGHLAPEDQSSGKVHCLG